MTDSLALTNKIAIITGSGRENGIGAAIALTLAKAGARVVINYVSDATSSRAEVVRSRIEAAAGKDSVVVVKADVSTEEGCKKIVGEALNKFEVDHIDIIGMTGLPTSQRQYNREAWDRLTHMPNQSIMQPP
jgi:NAD(P)-dependent dehydrogenase (short-subunit alcohol dehydrogenase family)